MDCSTLFLASVLGGDVWFCHGPAVLPPGITRHPLYTRLGGPHDRGARR